MSLSLSPTPLENRVFDALSTPSLQPSDERGNSSKNYNEEEDGSVVLVEAEEYKTSIKSKHASTMGDKSYNTAHHSFAEYLSHLVSGKFTNGCTTGTDTYTDTRAETATTRSKTKVKKKAECSSSHSRCIIENPENIQERRDDRGAQRRHTEHNDREEEDGGDETRDTTYSVEEISQISEITMDIPTVVAESKFAACAALPTIAEARRFDPNLAACTADVTSSPGKNSYRPRCNLTGGTSGKSGNGDMIDFMFELVEDAFCTPLNRSKADKKKAFIEAFQEESIKVARTNSMVDALHQTSSKQSRSNRTARRTGKSPGHTSPTLGNEKSPEQNDIPTLPARPSPPPEPVTRKAESGYTIVDKPPTPKPGPKMTTGTIDGEQSLDWSKIMSFAERQLEAEEKSVISKGGSRLRMSRSERRSFFSTADTPGKANNKSTIVTQPEKSVSNSASTHATASESATTDAAATVQEMRDISAMDSSSFDEESRRWFITSLIFGFFLQFFGENKRDGENSTRQKMLPHQVSYPKHEHINEIFMFKLFRYCVFFTIFIFWPSGIPRQKIVPPPLPPKPEKPSLLKLVFEKDEQ